MCCGAVCTVKKVKKKGQKRVKKRQKVCARRAGHAVGDANAAMPNRMSLQTVKTKCILVCWADMGTGKEVDDIDDQDASRRRGTKKIESNNE